MVSQRLAVDREVIVLGDAPEAGWVARGLADLGYGVRWVCSGTAPTGSSPGDLNLSVYGGCQLEELAGNVGNYAGRFRHNGQLLSISAAAMVVATGNQRYFPAERYGLSLSSNVLTVSQVEHRLEATRETGTTVPYRDQRIVTLLDWGGETAKETATQALRAAMRLRQRWHSEVYVFYQNLKVDTYNLERLTREAREQGVVFCRYEDLEIAVKDEGINLSYIEGDIPCALLVLPEAVCPGEDIGRLATLLRVNVGEDGYFQDVNIHYYRLGLSSRRGIFFAGHCHMDGDTAEIRADAIQAVANVDALLASGFLEPEEVIAHVDSAKCVRCLTCVRSCPHAAIELAEYDEVIAARVVDLACRGCGACVANCPLQAIELVGQAVPTWMQTT